MAASLQYTHTATPSLSIPHPAAPTQPGTHHPSLPHSTPIHPPGPPLPLLPTHGQVFAFYLPIRAATTTTTLAPKIAFLNAGEKMSFKCISTKNIDWKQIITNNHYFYHYYSFFFKYLIQNTKSSVSILATS